jgi:hypothetical protein
MTSTYSSSSAAAAPLQLPILSSPTPAGLASLARVLATRSNIWRPLVRYNSAERFYTRLAGGDGWEAWLLSWWPSQQTGLHDHGDSAGAFIVLDGALDETTLATRSRIGSPARLKTRHLATGDLRSFGPDHLHDVANNDSEPAVSLHVYGPALSRMTRYTLDDKSQLQIAARERAGADW